MVFDEKHFDAFAILIPELSKAMLVSHLINGRAALVAATYDASCSYISTCRCCVTDGG